MKTLDAIDLKLLARLQADAQTPLKELADHVNLSTTPCWRRLQALRENGVIRRHVALLDRAALRLSLVAFVMITTRRHDEEWVRSLLALVATMPEVMECHRLSGQTDYLLRVVVQDMPAYNHFYSRLAKEIDPAGISSTFSMQELKLTTSLPLNHYG